MAGSAAEEIDFKGAPPPDTSQQQQSCSSEEHNTPYLAAILTARTGNLENLKAALSSAPAADMLMVIPESRADGEQFPASVVAPDLPGASKLTHHSISWTDNFAEARNAALQVAQEAGEGCGKWLL